MAPPPRGGAHTAGLEQMAMKTPGQELGTRPRLAFLAVSASQGRLPQPALLVRMGTTKKAFLP